MTLQPASKKPFSPTRFDSDYISGVLKTIVDASIAEVDCSQLPGDASDRTYFRLSFQAGKDLHSLILMQLQKPLPSEETDFTRVLKFLKENQLPVPDLYHYDSAKGLLFLEDCGHTTLEDWIRDRPKDIEAYYAKAVELLCQLQYRATKNIKPDCPAYLLRFDVEKLMWELNFMLEHYVGGLHQSPLTEQEITETRRHLLPLCETLAAQELTFTHRDYHCRNLMVFNANLILLDFQDARMGPCQYDLASLLKDSYLHLDDDFRQEMIDLFIDLKEKNEGRKADRQEFYRIFDWMSVQRNLKAVGTFAFQSAVKGNSRYLQYIPGTLSYVRETLNRRPELHDLKQVLEKYLPGLTTGPLQK